MNPCRSDCPQGDCANCVGFGGVARAFSPSLPACMGGMCHHRDHCQRHVTGLRTASLDTARALYPDAPLKLAKHHNRAEALLIAHFGQRTMT